MKKWLICLLAVMMLLTSCEPGVTTDTSSTDTSSTDTSSTPEGSTDDLDSKYTVVSVGKPYTISGGPNESYPDTFGQQMTDGQMTPSIGVHYSDTRMVGFDAQATIQIDLGEDGKNVAGVAVRSLDMSNDGVGLANSVRFMVSTDGEKFDILGVKTFELSGEKTVSTLNFDFVENGKTIGDYRYIRVVISGRAGYFFYFLDEVLVYADVEEKTKTDYVQLAYQNESIDRNAWKSLSTGDVATPSSLTNTAAGLKYTFGNATFDERAPKEDSILTDSFRTARLFTDPYTKGGYVLNGAEAKQTWVGFNGNAAEAPYVQLDLKGKYQNIYSFKVHALGAGLNVRYPEYIDVYGSDDANNFTLLGRMYAPADCANYAYQLTMLEYVAARYIRFEFPKTEDGYYWVEELEVFTGYNREVETNMYPDLNFPTVTEEVYWDASEEDYTTVQNLLVGADQQMAAMYYDGLSENKWFKERSSITGHDFEGLHDGKLAETLSCYNGQFWMTRGFCTDIFYDMGHIGAISSLSVSALEQTSWNINRPMYITVYLSNDGDNWYQVGYDERKRGFDPQKDGNSDGTRIEYNFELDGTYAARFVRFRIEADRYASTAMFFDELSATGTKEVTADTKKLDSLGVKHVVYYTNPEREQYVDVSNSNINATDLALFVGNKGDEDMLLPYVAYLDENGEIKDTFMDGYIYWGPAVLSSGGGLEGESYKRDWVQMMEITFNGVNGLDRLEEVVGQVKEALNLPDYTVKVYVSTLNLFESVHNFGGLKYNEDGSPMKDEEGNNMYFDGDCNGDGVNENLSTPEGRQIVIDWYINSVKAEFEARGYKNIVLDGFNWVAEQVNYSANGSADNTHIMKEFSDRIHAADTNFIWIPFYYANRFYLGNDMEFDAICMQPNYVFNNKSKEYQFEAAADAVSRLNMSIEIEHSYQCLGDPGYARSYMLYLKYGVEYGYINGIHMYYQDQDNFALMGYSDEPLCRMQYDATYHFVKRDLDITPDVKDTMSFSGAADTILKGTLNTENALELYTLVKQPEHGIIALNSNGEFVYYPEKGYTGSDSFSYTYNEYLAESEECVVNITIG